MSAVRRAWRRCVSLFKRHDLDREFDDEVRAHLALATDDYVQRGVPLAEAQRLARLKFGSLAASKDAHRDARGLPWLEGLFFDLRLALRALRRDWAFTVAAIAMLALALALNTTVFTVMDAMLFRGLPLASRSDRLVYIGMRKPSDSPCCPGPLSYEDFEAWRSQAQAFDDLAFRGPDTPVAFRDGNGRPIDLAVPRVSANTFGLLGVRPILGRDFVAADEAPGAASVVILSHHFWESRFGKRADIVGTAVHVNGAPATVIGVMPEGFTLVYQQDLWMLLAHTPGLQGSAIGRLRDGAGLQQARAELETITWQLQAADSIDRGVPSVLTYSQAHLTADAPMIFGSLWAGAWFVLLIACANVTNLILMRTVGRWREFATRMALGAGQRRLIRQMAMESSVLAGVAGVIAWWITAWSVRTWAAATASRYLVLDYTVHSGTLAYLLGATVVAAILFSFAPVTRVVQLGVNAALKGDARGVTRNLRGKHLARGLVAAQMALAIVLLSAAGVVVRSFINIVGAETGVRDPDEILVGLVRLPSDKYPSAEARLQYLDDLEEELRAIPGTDGVSVASSMPVRYAPLRPFEIEGISGSESAPSVGSVSAGADYFRVVGVSPTSGRAFTDDDRASSAPVAIVNERFAATYWPAEQPLGKRLRVKDGDTPGKWLTVVGVVPNIMQGDATRQNFKPLVYVPFRQDTPARAVRFLVRTNVTPEYVAPVVRAELQQLDPDVILEDFTTLDAKFAFDRDFMDLEHSELGKHAAVAPVFAGIALLLAATGLVAVMAHTVSQRTKEIGVRMAIGAAATDISRMVLRQGMVPVAIGLSIGLAASLAVNRILQSQLVGVSPYDPMTMAGAPVLLVGVALVACQIPARRAVRVDPVVALRHE